MARMAYIALLAVVLGLAACGGDDDGPAGADSGDRQAQTAADDETRAGEEAADRNGAEPEESEPAREGSGDGDSASAALSRSEYIARADRICREAQEAVGVQGRKIQALVRAVARGKIDRSEYFRRSGALTGESARVAGEAVAELEELPRPDSRRAALEAYLAATAETARLLAAQAAEQRSGDAKAVVRLNRQLGAAGEKTRAAARRFGFQRCGGG